MPCIQVRATVGQLNTCMHYWLTTSIIQSAMTPSPERQAGQGAHVAQHGCDIVEEHTLQHQHSSRDGERGRSTPACQHVTLRPAHGLGACCAVCVWGQNPLCVMGWCTHPSRDYGFHGDVSSWAVGPGNSGSRLGLHSLLTCMRLHTTHPPGSPSLATAFRLRCLAVRKGLLRPYGHRAGLLALRRTGRGPCVGVLHLQHHHLVVLLEVWCNGAVPVCASADGNDRSAGCHRASSARCVRAQDW